MKTFVAALNEISTRIKKNQNTGVSMRKEGGGPDRQ